MDTTTGNIDYQGQLEKALSIIEAQQLTIQSLQLEIIGLKKIVFGSCHERFIAAASQHAPTLFDVHPIAEVAALGTTTVSYEKTKKPCRRPEGCHVLQFTGNLQKLSDQSILLAT